MLDSLQALPQALRDAAYDNTAAVRDSAAQLASFDARSDALLARAEGQIDQRYGQAERQVFDFFPGRADAPTLLFIHGGYWQMRHKNSFRFVAEGALALGLNAALLGYTLAPQASLTQIVAQVRQGIAAVRAHALAQGRSGELLLCGWSAGGHLTALGLACEGVRAGLGISGIYDLAPLQHTYLNTALQLTSTEVRTLSPLYLPLVDKPFITAFGTAELPQLQAQSLALSLLRQGCEGGLLAVDGGDHFSILNALAAPDGVLLQRLVAFI
ncbi:alpha/beta hydrolase [Acidovorax sp. CCYZU-2555]|uniref:alpha/beta hydrolase n=1 Tax=Acidovorax sp. CCYZU-2555 TaxID=2835042 RepID=UPI001BCF7C01|nr:alpha/beta hydrolase [Acidovorax sp. CCYZU-2555]MBS7776734.1 alpha/beta hydrolase [Acidovorax sp. CCYZU-2555]